MVQRRGPDSKARHDTLAADFKRVFGFPPSCRSHAPGRVNVIGEHVDYNEGLALPMAIDLYCHVASSPRGDKTVRVFSAQYEEMVEFSLLDIGWASGHWSDYVKGVVWSLLEGKQPLCGADLLISSEVPPGSGLSSSAALEVATALALLEASGLTMAATDLALACQQAENGFVGARIGVMDQMAACHGRKGHLLLLDCRSLETEYVPFDESEVRLVIANTMVKHALASSQYNQRRIECEDALARLHSSLPAVHSLRDVTWPEIEQLAGGWPDPIRRRARHVTSEIGRVGQFVSAVASRGYTRAGALMSASHQSLRDDYQVSCTELDVMVDLAMSIPGVYGSRMTGAGFGGCTVSLVRASRAGHIAATLGRQYEIKTGVSPQVSVAHSAAGMSGDPPGLTIR